MKKFFKNLAFASLAIAGILVSSCKIEDIKTTFQPTNAVATITVTALDAYNGNVNVSNDPALKLSTNINSGNVSISGNVITVTGNPAIAETSFTIFGDYKGNSGQANVTVNSLLAGGQGTYEATVVIGIPDPAFAYAFIDVNGFDAATSEDVTSKFTPDIDFAGDYSVITGPGFIIVKSEQGIAGGKATITGKYNNINASTEVNIDAIEKYDYKNYAATLVFGTAPVADPAQVDVTVTVFDSQSYTDVTKDSKIQASIVGGGDLTIKDNIVTVVAKDNKTPLPAMTLAIGATYNGHKAIEDELNIAEIPAGIKAKYSITVFIGSQATYSCIPVDRKEVKKVVGTFVSSHGHATYTHDYKHATTGHGEGEGEWLYNETEFILKTEVAYTPWTGIIIDNCGYTMAEGSNELDEVYVNSFYEGYISIGLDNDTEKILPIEVSAWAMYSVYGTKTFSDVTYEVYRRLPGDTDGKLVGTIVIREVSTNAEYCEAAMPGHDGHYVHGHGHDDVHGYSSNAGGGIFWNE